MVPLSRTALRRGSSSVQVGHAWLACRFSILVPFLEELGGVDRRKTILGSFIWVTTWMLTALWAWPWLLGRAWRNPEAGAALAQGWESGWAWMCRQWDAGTGSRAGLWLWALLDPALPLQLICCPVSTQSWDCIHPALHGSPMTSSVPLSGWESICLRRWPRVPCLPLGMPSGHLPHSCPKGHGPPRPIVHSFILLVPHLWCGSFCCLHRANPGRVCSVRLPLPELRHGTGQVWRGNVCAHGALTKSGSVHYRSLWR